MKILHLSDLHLGEDKSAISKNLSPECYKSYLGSMIDAVKSKEGATHLICTGDFGHKGYLGRNDDAITIIQYLSKGLNIHKDNVFCCPGNHDFLWIEKGVFWMKKQNRTEGSITKYENLHNQICKAEILASDKAYFIYDTKDATFISLDSLYNSPAYDQPTSLLEKVMNSIFEHLRSVKQSTPIVILSHFLLCQPSVLDPGFQEEQKFSEKHIIKNGFLFIRQLRDLANGFRRPLFLCSGDIHRNCLTKVEGFFLSIAGRLGGTPSLRQPAVNLINTDHFEQSYELRWFPDGHSEDIPGCWRGLELVDHSNNTAEKTKDKAGIEKKKQKSKHDKEVIEHVEEGDRVLPQALKEDFSKEKTEETNDPKTEAQELEKLYQEIINQMDELCVEKEDLWSFIKSAISSDVLLKHKADISKGIRELIMSVVGEEIIEAIYKKLFRGDRLKTAPPTFKEELLYLISGLLVFSVNKEWLFASKKEHDEKQFFHIPKGEVIKNIGRGNNPQYVDILKLMLHAFCDALFNMKTFFEVDIRTGKEGFPSNLGLEKLYSFDPTEKSKINAIKRAVVFAFDRRFPKEEEVEKRYKEIIRLLPKEATAKNPVSISTTNGKEYIPLLRKDFPAFKHILILCPKDMDEDIFNEPLQALSFAYPIFKQFNVNVSPS